MTYPNSKLVYLASPYTHKESAIVLERFHTVCRWSAVLLNEGVHVLSPIAHSHPIAVASRGLLDPLDWKVWQNLDFAVLDRCDELWLCNLDGWRNSVGCKAEVERAKSQGKPCYLLSLQNGEPLLQPVDLEDFRV